MDSLDDGGKARKRKLAAPSDGTGNDSGGDKGGTLTAAEIATLLERHTRQLAERVQVQIDGLEAKNAALEEECRSLQQQIDELNKDSARVCEDHRARCDSLERSIQVSRRMSTGRTRPLPSRAATGLNRDTARNMPTIWKI